MRPRLPALLEPPLAFGQADPATDLDEGGAVTADGLGDGEVAEPTGADRLAAVLEWGAGGVAVAAWITADGVPVLSRTGRVGSRLRRRQLSTVDSGDLPPTVVRLTELYRRIGTTPALSLDLGDPGAFEAIVATAREAGPGAEDRLWLCHPDIATLTAWRARTSARLINAVAYRAIDTGLERRAAELEERGIDGLRLGHRDWTGGRVTLLHRFARLALGVGPVHDREAAALVDTGIDAVYAERVATMVAVVARFYGTD